MEFERVDATAAWPCGEEQFDVVSIIDVMHHVPVAAQRSVIETASRRVKPGGMLLYKDMCRRPLWRAWANRLHDLVVARQWINYAAVQDVERWASEAGMRVVERERINRLWYGHELRRMKAE